MFKSESILVFIGARGGSRGFKNKNIADFDGRPMIAWTIDAGRKSRYVDRVLVSTDSADIMRVSKEAGADTPFVRPAELATDQSWVGDAIVHAMDWIESNEKRTYDHVILLMPTSPLRTAPLVDKILEHYFTARKSPEDTIVTVSPVPNKMAWIMSQNEAGYINFAVHKARVGLNRQQLPDYYLPNGVFYMAPWNVMKRDRTFYTDHTLSFVTDEEESVDVDSPADLEKAVEVLKKWKASKRAY